MELDTVTHILRLYSEEDKVPFYHLIEKKRPHATTPLPLGKKTSFTSNGRVAYLDKCAIGEVLSSEDLESFQATWSQTALLSQIKSETKNKNNDKTPKNVVRKFLSSKATDLQSRTLLQLRVVTWNVHGQSIDSLDLDALTAGNSDIYVLGLQESDPLTNLTANAKTLQTVTDVITRKTGHRLVCSRQLLGIMVTVFCDPKVMDLISHVTATSTGTGFLNVWGNKGAALVSLRIGADPTADIAGTLVQFVCCHLAAGESDDDNNARRAQLEDISRRLDVPQLTSPYLSHAENLFDADSTSEPDPVVHALDLEDHLIFVFGDLNYRVSFPAESIRNLALEKKYGIILQNDQLRRDVRAGVLFSGFVEGEIDFAPTYKFRTTSPDESASDSSSHSSLSAEEEIVSKLGPGTEQRQYDESRTPSYTDRILYTPNPDIRLKTYKSVSQYDISDHDPVLADFEMNLNTIDKAQRTKTLVEAFRHSDKIENTDRSSVQVTPQVINEICTVLEPVELEVELHNTGRHVDWFVVDPKSHEKAGLSISPSSGALPKDARQKILLSACLGVQDASLSRVVIVRVEENGDQFISVQLDRQSTCLGASLENMCRRPNGAINSVELSSSPTNMPRELWVLIDYLWKRTYPGLFKSLKRSDPLLSPLEKQIQNWLDYGKDLDLQVLESANEISLRFADRAVASRLMLLLETLDGGVVPSQYYSYAMQGSSGVPAVLESMPNINANVFLYLSAFLNTLSLDDGKSTIICAVAVSLFQLGFLFLLLTVDLLVPLIVRKPDRTFTLSKRKLREFVLSASGT